MIELQTQRRNDELSLPFQVRLEYILIARLTHFLSRHDIRNETSYVKGNDLLSLIGDHLLNLSIYFIIRCGGKWRSSK